MAQIAALFLPKGSDVRRTPVKQTPIKSKRKQKQVKLAVLLKGKNSGNQKNSTKLG